MTENQIRILIVEDNADNRTLIKDVLDAMNYEVVEAVDGVEGVEKALSSNPSLILMDLSLPHKDGWEATRELKTHASMKSVPIIALTAHAMVGDKERAIEAGCDDYISKPINLAELNEKIKKYVAQSIAAAKPAENATPAAQSSISAATPTSESDKKENPATQP
jgi:two-component system, cell cycle response regulator DivK